MSVTIKKPEGWTEESFEVRTEDRWDWMEVTIRSKGSMIHVKFNSSFVAGAYNWNHCGDDVDWRKWLEDTDFSYFMGKMFGNGYRVFSLEKTIQCCISTVDDHAAYFGLNDVEAEGLRRALLQIQDEMEEEFPDDDRRLVEKLYDLNHCLFNDSPWEYLCQEDRKDLRRFWDELWRPFIEGVQK